MNKANAPSGIALQMHPEQLSRDAWEPKWTRDGPPWGATRVDPSDLVPTMLARRELDYLQWLGEHAGGLGRVIELGCFLGGSTAALISGRRAAGCSDQPVIVYDSFCAPDEGAFEADPVLASFGIRPDTSFRELYERLHASRKDELLIREGCVRPDMSVGEAADLYPERSPIGLLFVDIAKAWGVHTSVINVFFPFVRPGGIIVQQDFGDFRTPWLIIQMWQLRRFFEPLHRIGETCSHSFRRTRTEPIELGVISESARSTSSSIWPEIAEYWAPRLGITEDATGWLAGYRASHCIHAGRWAESTEATKAHESWRESPASDGVHQSDGWDPWLIQFPERIKRLGADQETLKKAARLAGIARERQSLRPTDNDPGEVWREISAELIAGGFTGVALYGGGRHTRKLLSGGWIDPEISVVCIIDDNPSTDRIGAIPVVSPHEFVQMSQQFPRDKIALIPSSDAYEESIITRAEPLAGKTGTELIRAYTR